MIGQLLIERAKGQAIKWPLRDCAHRGLYDGAMKQDLQTHQERPAKSSPVDDCIQHAPLLSTFGSHVPISISPYAPKLDDRWVIE
jgi:hypothetical protein